MIINNKNKGEMKMSKYRKNTGITLISLVIIIVVMLILTSVIIATINGQSDTIDKADDAKIYTELKQLQEEIEKYKIERYSTKNLRKGDFSNKASNDDLINDEIVKKYANIKIDKADIVRATNTDQTKENAQIGVININKLKTENNVEIDSSLGEGISNYLTDDTAKTNLLEFTNVFALDLDDNTIYYVDGEKIWKLDN